MGRPDGSTSDEDRDDEASGVSDGTGRRSWREQDGTTENTNLALAKQQEIHGRIVQYYRDIYDTSAQKAELATTVAENEHRLVKGIDLDNAYCLYVGIPFCPSRCLYCSFTSYPIGIYAEKAKTYIDTLCKELAYVAEQYKHKRLVAIYIGGGTRRRSHMSCLQYY